MKELQYMLNQLMFSINTFEELQPKRYWFASYQWKL